jgi:uncharacterized membrane protein YjgN (DUF898 family)
LDFFLISLKQSQLRANLSTMDDNSTPSEAPAPLRLEQRGRAGELLPVVLRNTLLNIATLSIYRFWGKTKIRQYLWRQTHFMAEPLEYTGTGGELFKGFLVVFFLILVPLAVVSNVVNFYLDPENPANLIVPVILYMTIGFLIGFAIYRARRYRLSRTVWRGIRGGMRGSASQYALRYLLFWASNMITLGWTYPWMQFTLFKRLMKETTFGDRPFQFDGSLKPLYGAFAIVWFGSLFGMLAAGHLIWGVASVFGAFNARPGLPLSIWQIGILLTILMLWTGMAWYKAREINLLASGTSFEGLTFGLEASAWSLLGLKFFNILIIILTLGFGQPFAQLRVFRYVCERLSITGEVDVAAIQQSSAAVPTMGEGLADAFDLGAV